MQSCSSILLRVEGNLEQEAAGLQPQPPLVCGGGTGTPLHGQLPQPSRRACQQQGHRAAHQRQHKVHGPGVQVSIEGGWVSQVFVLCSCAAHQRQHKVLGPGVQVSIEGGWVSQVFVLCSCAAHQRQRKVHGPGVQVRAEGGAEAASQYCSAVVLLTVHNINVSDCPGAQGV
eukprot:1161095-Pelagomonas_calceolata.AAC.7